MIVRQFKACVDKEFGNFGLLPLWLAQSNAGGGFSVAHDIMEHTRKDDGGAEHEFRAFGAMILTRVIPQYFERHSSRMNTPAEILALDFPYFMRKVYDGVQTLNDPGKTSKIRPHDGFNVEAFIDDVLGAAHRYCVSEIQNDTTHETIFTNDDADRIRGWMRQGFRLACDRYRGISPYILMETFDAISRDADQRTINRYQEGEKITFRVHPGRAIVSVSRELDY